jgi:cytochrome c551/c552
MNSIGRTLRCLQIVAVGTGVWGEIPMTPHPDVQADAENGPLCIIVGWRKEH